MHFCGELFFSEMVRLSVLSRANGFECFGPTPIQRINVSLDCLELAIEVVAVVVTSAWAATTTVDSQ